MGVCPVKVFHGNDIITYIVSCSHSRPLKNTARNGRVAQRVHSPKNLRVRSIPHEARKVAFQPNLTPVTTAVWSVYCQERGGHQSKQACERLCAAAVAMTGLPVKVFNSSHCLHKYTLGKQAKTESKLAKNRTQHNTVPGSISLSAKHHTKKQN